MDKGLKILSDITCFTKYARYIPTLERRETWNELVTRNMQMHIRKFPDLKNQLEDAYQLVFDKKVLPSMRSLQFAGKPIELNNARLFNCAYLPIDHYKSFSETMYLLLSGCGVGYSIQFSHINKLPEVRKPIKKTRYLVEDSIIGWAEAIRILIKSYYTGNTKPIFDFSDIRPKGALLITSGGKAPGKEPLARCLFEIEQIFESKQNGDKLKSVECHSILCHIADAVLSGGIRRSAMIALFSFDDEDMIGSKSGNWWETNPHFARANNSAVIVRNRCKKKDFNLFWDRIKASGAGEPGILWTNNPEYGTNPCVIGETEILTKEGYKRIDSLIDKKTEIWNGFEWSIVTPKITGYNQPLLKVSLSDGRSLTCTKYHKWHLSKGYHGEQEEVIAQNLHIGDKIIKYNFPTLTTGEQVSLKHAYTQGFISAEGMDDYKYFWLYEPKYMCQERLDIKNEGSEFSNFNGIKRKTLWYNDVYEDKDFVPFDWCLTSKIEWLSGLLDGDGTELKEGGCQIVSINLNFLNNLQKILSTLGINCKISSANEEGIRSLPDGKGGKKDYFCNTSHRLCIGAVQMQDLKRLGLECNRMCFNKSPQRDASQFTKIVKIEDAGYADAVYCFNEPIRHYGVFNGILTGQCAEISLRPYSFCNLVEINGGNIENHRDFQNRCKKAAFIATIQASYTDFVYLRPIWKEHTDKDALIGVGITGIASNTINPEWLSDGANLIKEINEETASKIGIRKSARCTTVKPSGTTSCILGCSSGIHAWYNDYYVRRMRIGKNESLYTYFQIYHPEILEDELFKPHEQAVISIPIKATENAIVRNEDSLSFLDRVKTYNEIWIQEGHRSGPNYNNVSATVSIKEEEWEKVGKWMWDNREYYTGISVLPYNGGTYKQSPFTDCTKEEYEKLMEHVHDIDLTKVIELENNTNLSENLACVAGQCEI